MKKESKRHILSTVAVILAAVAAVTVLFVLHHKQQQEKARQPEESISQEEDNTIEWNGKRYTYNNNLINILFLGIDHANERQKADKMVCNGSRLHFYILCSGKRIGLSGGVCDRDNGKFQIKCDSEWPSGYYLFWRTWFLDF